MSQIKDMAEQCCKPRICACGKECEPYRTICNGCLNEQQEKQEVTFFEKAEKLTAWDGWVYCEGVNDDYFESVDDLLERCDDEGIDRPKYVWACKADHFVNADIEDITSRLEDTAYEDFDFADLAGLSELKAALEAFNEANKDKVSYTPDYTKAVLIQPVCA